MRRRDFITLLGGAAAWPLPARAQQPAKILVGWLSTASAAGSAYQLAAFRDGLREAGFVEGQNVVIEYRWADDHAERLPAMAADLVGRQVGALVVGGGTAAALAAKAATKTTPIVFVVAADPVRAGIVASLNRPGSNMTGIVGFADLLITKRLESLTELLPNARVFGALLNASNPNSESRAGDLQTAAKALGRDIRLVWASSPDGLDKAIAGAAEQKLEALVVQNDSLFTDRHDVIDLAADYRIPAIYESREDAMAGGLVSYGPDVVFEYRTLGSYTGRILKGEKPADLPIMQPTRFELVINLKTAKALGLTVPPNVLAIADEVIE
jgi:putative ABC transport system substrate-binding protein